MLWVDLNWEDYYHLNDNGELVNTKTNTIPKANLVTKTVKGKRYTISVMNLIWFLGTNEKYPANLYRIDRNVGYKLNNISKDYPYVERKHNRKLPKYIYSRESIKRGTKYEVIIPMGGKLYNIGIFYQLDDAIACREYVLSKGIPIKMSGKLKGYTIGKYEKTV